MDVRSVSSSQEQNGAPVRDSLSLTVLGVCTGTGLGCDKSVHEAALTLLASYSPFIQFDRIAIPAATRDPVASYLGGSHLRAQRTLQLDDLLGRLFTDGIKTFCRKNKLDPASIDLVSTHSEALRHLAVKTNVESAKEHPLYWNSVIAAETGISTVFDHTVIERTVNRPHIYPVAYVDRVFLRHPTKFRVCLNIDEIANLSFIPPHADDGARAAICRDCGPGGLLIDYAMRYCTSNDKSEDNEGDLGAMGKINQHIVNQFLDTRDYLRQPPLMSIATEMFGDHEAQQLIDECLYINLSEADTIATVTRATAQNILKQYNRLLELFFPSSQKVDEIFICGPSARNTNIIDYLESELPESVITKPLHDIGIPSDAHEAFCYAYLALEAVLGQATQTADSSPAAQPSTDAVRASIVPGKKWNELLSQMLKFSGGQKIPVATDVRILGGLEAAVRSMDIH